MGPECLKIDSSCSLASNPMKELSPPGEKAPGEQTGKERGGKEGNGREEWKRTSSNGLSRIEAPTIDTAQPDNNTTGQIHCYSTHNTALLEHSEDSYKHNKKN